jgi:hypothetical protein
MKSETVLQGMGKTLMVMGEHALMFGGVVCIFTATEAGMEILRGRSDWMNGVVAGFAAGVASRADTCASNIHFASCRGPSNSVLRHARCKKIYGYTVAIVA